VFLRSSLRGLASSVGLALIMGFFGLVACGGGGGGNNSPTPTKYTVTASVGTGTTATPLTQQVQSGQTATLTVGLLSGYNTLVVIGGGGTLNGNTYTTSPITGNTTITTSATADPVYYTVTANVGIGTTATPTTQQVQAGQTATLSVGLLSGYNTLVVTGGGGTLNGNTYTTGPITGNTTVTTSATANPVYYTVTANVGTGTTATPTTQQVQAGQTATLSVGLLSGYGTLVVTGGGGTLNGNTYTTGPIFDNTTVTTSATAITVAINRTDNFILALGQTLQLRAAVVGSANQDVTWEILDGGPGSISSTGLYTAPSTPLASAAPCRVKVTSNANPAATDSVSLALQRDASTDFFLAEGSDLHLAFAGETKNIHVRFVSSSGLATVASATLLYSGPGAPPVLEAGNVVRWTPDALAVGMHTIVLRVLSSNGTQTDLPLSVEVVSWRRIIAGTCGNEGGVLANPTGEFILQVPAGALQGGFSSIDVVLDVAYRSDGTRIDRPSFTGLRDEIIVKTTFPANPVATVSAAKVSGPANHLRASAPALSWQSRQADPFANNRSGLDLVFAWSGDRWDEVNRRSGWLSTDRDMYQQYFRRYDYYHHESGDDKVDNQPMALLFGEVTNASDMVMAGIDRDKCQPVLFVHGFTPEMDSDKWGFYGAGGDGTWGKSAEMMLKIGSSAGIGLDVVCFEFVWKTSARFEDQAFHLSQAIQKIVEITGKKPIVFGHSFGGVLAVTYILGLAEDVNATPRRVPYQDNIAHLVTIGSPLSGIRWAWSSGESAPATATTNEDGQTYTLGTGRDPDDTTMQLGAQWTMFATGGKSVGDFGDIMHAAIDTPGQINFHKALGFYMEPAGYTTGRLGLALKSLKAGPSNLFPCPLTIMVAQRSGFGGPGVDDYTPCLTYGDGLISWVGQLLDPADEGVLGRLYQGFVFPGYGYRYFDMPTNDGYAWYGGAHDRWPGSTKFGFTHTEVQGNGAPIPKLNWRTHIGVNPAMDLQDATHFTPANAAEVKLFHVPAAETAKVALGYALGVPGSGNQGGVQQFFPHPLYIVAEDVLKKVTATVGETYFYKVAQCKGKVSQKGVPAAGQPVIIRIREGATILNRSDVTDVDGTFNIRFETSYTATKPFNASRYTFSAAVGNDQEYLATTGDRYWEDVIDFGNIEIVKRTDATANSGFTGVVRTPAGAALAGATVQVRLGDGLTAASFHSLNPFPQTQSSQQLVSGASGEVTASGLIPGKYTALVMAAGYPEGLFVFSIPAIGVVPLQLNNGTSTIAITPGNLTLTAGATQQFTASVSLAGTANPTVVWAVEEAAGGNISGAGMYLAPAVAGIYHIRASLAGDPNVMARVVVQVQPVQVGGTFTATGSMQQERTAHTSTLLPNGQVLIAGGYNYSSNELTAAEIFDPAIGQFTATGSMQQPRRWHTATRLNNGKVLVVGGYAGGYLSSAEVYDPNTGLFTATGSIQQPRFRHTATLLPDGKVLIAGGDGGGALSSAELYDPATGVFTTTGQLQQPRAYHSATLLPGGKVLIAGGYASDFLSSAELYDPTTGIFTATGSMQFKKSRPEAILLLDGKVLFPGSASATSELYDSATGLFTATGSMKNFRTEYTATLLPDGKVLVTGGYTVGGPDSPWLSSAEIYDPALGLFRDTGSMQRARLQHTATLLSGGKVLIVGGGGYSQALISSAELYTPDGLVPTTFTLPGNVQLELVHIPGGAFMMGSPETEQDRYSWEVQHQVTVNSFYMAKFETTINQWMTVFGLDPNSNPSEKNYPCVWGSHDEISQPGGFLDLLNAKTVGIRPAGFVFRLPTEAEWEYAARGGTASRFYWGDDPSYIDGSDFAWWPANTASTHPVGQKLPNGYGLFDMSGNALEWCQDWWGGYGGSPQTNPVGPASGVFRVMRGGGTQCLIPNYQYRSAARLYDNPSVRPGCIGFRVVLAEPRTP